VEQRKNKWKNEIGTGEAVAVLVVAAVVGTINGLGNQKMECNSDPRSNLDRSTAA